MVVEVTLDLRQILMGGGKIVCRHLCLSKSN